MIYKQKQKLVLNLATIPLNKICLNLKMLQDF